MTHRDPNLEIQCSWCGYVHYYTDRIDCVCPKCGDDPVESARIERIWNDMDLEPPENCNCPACGGD